MVKIMSRHKVDICGLQEVKWRGVSARLVERKDSRHKMFWEGNDKGMVGVGVLFAEKRVEEIFDVKCVRDKSCSSNLYENVLCQFSWFMLHKLILI